MGVLLLSPQLSGRTFRENFCAEAGYSAGDFEPIILRHCLHRRARIFMWLTGGANNGFFARDRALITRVGDAVTIDEIRQALNDHQCNPANYTWFRRMLGVRISTQRLRWIASHYVPLGMKIIE